MDSGQTTHIQLISEKQSLVDQLELERQKTRQLEHNLENERNAHIDARQKLERSQANLEISSVQAEEKIQLLKQAQETLKLEFQNLANSIMEEKSQKFTEQNKHNLEGLMNPLREQLKEFKKKVEDTYDKESRDRLSLFEQIKNLQSLNVQLSEEAHNLTKALKGDSQVQGSWGELVLETILEKSGLEKGREYETQNSFTNTQNDSERQRYRPDVLIHLPENKTIIVDSKVSLTAYEQYCNAEDDSSKQKALNDHVSSVRNHVKKLSDTAYQNIESLRTLDFVVMFMPIEAAFLIAMQTDQELHPFAMDKNIFIVSPSNLLVMLRTIHHSWKNERQNQNALEIADKAGRMYDKFVGFVEDMDAIGQRISQTQKAWDEGMKKLSTSSGNLVKRSEELKKLGAKASKQISNQLLDKSDTEDTE